MPLLAAKIIRTAQSLGMPLKEILAISQQRRAGKMTTERSVQVLRAQLERLELKAAELVAMQGYLRAKIDWLSGGETGPQPDFGAYLEQATNGLDKDLNRTLPSTPQPEHRAAL